jgi:putative NADH-flavin reductase
MRIAVIGATGWLGGAVMREALERGHEVTTIARHPDKLAELRGVKTIALDATDPEALVAAIADHDAVVAAVTDRSGPDRSVIPAAARALIEAASRAGVPRVAWVGGGGSLAAPNGQRLVDQPGFPKQYKAEALAQGEALDLFRAAPESLDWTYLSPPPHHLEPGEKRGGYRVQAGDQPVLDAEGVDGISSGDFAAALVDELEQHRFSRQRFTAGY